MYRRKDYIGFHIICTALATAAVAFVAGLALFGIKSLLSLFTVTEASFFIGVIGGAISLCSTILVSALGIAAITGLYLYHCSRNGTLYNSVMPYSHRPNFDFDLSGMKLVAFVFSLTSAAVFVVLIVALVVMSHTSLLTTHTELLMKLAYMDVAAVYATSLSFIAAVLFGIGDAYKSMH
jgi:hypothetical protein